MDNDNPKSIDEISCNKCEMHLDHCECLAKIIKSYQTVAATLDPKVKDYKNNVLFIDFKKIRRLK